MLRVCKTTYQHTLSAKGRETSAPAFGGHIHLDEALPHLRAAAGIYADVQADEIRLYLGDLAFDYWKPLSLPLMREVGFAQQNSEGENVSAQLKTTIPSAYETEYMPSVSCGCEQASSDLISSAKGGANESATFGGLPAL